MALQLGVSEATRRDAVITTASMNEAAKNAWCWKQGVYAVADPSKASVHPQAKPQKSRRIKDLGRNLRRLVRISAHRGRQGRHARPALQGQGVAH